MRCYDERLKEEEEEVEVAEMEQSSWHFPSPGKLGSERSSEQLRPGNKTRLSQKAKLRVGYRDLYMDRKRKEQAMRH